MSSGITRSVVVLAPLLAVLCIVALWNPREEIWTGVESPKAQVEAYDASQLKSVTSVDTSIYDETKLGRLFREPQNTVSNLAFIAVGLAVGLSSRRRLSRSFAVACAFLGVGSGLYHASLLPEWRMVDILGVYVVLLSLVSMGLACVIRRPVPELVMIVAVWMAGFGAGIFRNDVRVAGVKALDSTYVVVSSVAAVSLLALWCVRLTSERRRYLLRAAILALASAGAIFGGVTDRFGGIWAAPEAVVQGHAVWHTLGAVALLMAYEIFALAGYDRSTFATSDGPNEVPDPTPEAVTTRAGARPAPASVVAHL